MKQFLLLICLLSIGTLSLSAQNLPLNDPTTKQEWIDYNSAIAHAFSPLYFQYYNNTHGDDGRHDMPLRVNYDNDWLHLNNWDHDHLIDVPSMHPAAYYHIFWEDAYWIAVYSFYHPRDYANNGLFCRSANHEGDLEEVYVFIERPTSENYVAKDLLKGFVTNNHGNFDYLNCVSPNQMQVITSSSVFTEGAHPRIYVSAGSHAIYTSKSDAKSDETTSRPGCRPNATEGNTFTLGAVEADTGTRSFGGIMNSYGYHLIDLFETPDHELWSHRNSTNVFQSADFLTRATQKFNGDNPNSNSAKASAPWREKRYDPNVILGDPINPQISGWPPEITFDSYGQPFDCDCKIGDDPCTEVSFNPSSYLFNGLKCGEYKMKEPSLNSSTNSLKFTLQTSYAFNPAVDEIEWEIISPIDFTCSGCGSNSKTITISPVDGVPCDNSVNVTVKTTITSVECDVANYFSYYSNYYPCESGNFVEVNVFGCMADLMYQNHNVNNTYEWDFTPDVNFFSWGPFAEVFADPYEGTQYISYSLTVNNGTPVTGYFTIECDEDDPVLLISPNPSDDQIRVKIEMDNAQILQQGVDIVIVDQFSNVKSNFKTNQAEVQLDVSQFPEGVYYLLVMGETGELAKTNFVVSRAK